MGCIWPKLDKDICFLIALHIISCSALPAIPAIPVTCLNRWVKLESWRSSFFFFFFCRTQLRVSKHWQLTGHLKINIDRLYVSLFAAKVYYQLSLSNRKHRSWRLVLLHKSFKEIEDVALQTFPIIWVEVPRNIFGAWWAVFLATSSEIAWNEIHSTLTLSFGC